VLSAVHLTRRFGNRVAVEDATFEIARGEIFALLGPNGAGKTTTLRMLAGLIEPSTGEVHLSGHRVGRGNAERLRARVGLLTEAPGLWDRLTVRENLLTYAWLHGLSEPDQAVERSMTTFGLSDRANDAAALLSKGLKQRVALARTLLHNPDIVLLDEPTSGLDPESAREVRELIVKLRGVPAQSPLSRVVAEIIDAWAVRKGIVYARADSAALEFETQTADHLPAWVKYLLAFDVKYRERRLQFLIEGQNRLYQLLGQEHFAGFNPIAIDRLKREFYARLDALRRRESAAFYSDEVRALVADIFPAEPSSGEAKHLVAYASRFVEQHADKLDRLIERLAAEIDLDAKTRELDDLLASLDPKEWHPEARREVLINYLGFPFWDVLTFPITSGRPFGELNEILIDRISPQDAHALEGFDGSESLKGAGFGHFAAFFSRAYRENDYLLGRLHALDRLIDIVCDAAGIETNAGGIDVLALKKRGFVRILDVEERHLTHSKQLIASLRQRVDELGVDALGVDDCDRSGCSRFLLRRARRGDDDLVGVDG